MFHIAICDDEKELIIDLKSLLRRYEEESGRELCVSEFGDGSELLQNYQSDFDLIFMDIQMEKLDGLKTAEKIRRMDDTVGLFFLTSLPQYVWKGYEYGAANYLLKPLKYARLKMELDRFFSRYQGKEEPYLSFANDTGKYKVLHNLHGFGISNMERAAETYGGTCTIAQENNKFTLKILIPIP